MKLLLACLAVLAMAAAPALAAPIEVSTPTPLSDADMKLIEAGFETALIDPYSAHFIRVIGGVKKDGSLDICGFVNSKNRLGAYVGAEPFIGDLWRGTGAEFLVVGIAGADTRESDIIAMCAERGLGLK